MKKAGAILFLLVILFNTAGFFVAFKVAQYTIKKDIKKAMKSNIPIDKLTKFTFSKSEYDLLKWEEEGKEFFVGDNMYDIVSTKEEGNRITVLCINDNAEETLFAHLENQVNNELSTTKPFNGKQTKLVLENIVVLLFFNNTQIHFSSSISNHLYFSNRFTYESIILDRTSPPPKTA